MRQNFEPKVWGPHAWFFLETIAMGYSTDPTYEEKKAAENFFNSLHFMIPCDKCRNNYKKHLKIHPLNEKVLSSRDNLFMWIVDVHNSVDSNNTRSYDDTFKYYMKEFSVEVNDNIEKKDNPSILFYLLIIIFIIFLIYQIYLNF